MDEMVYEEIRPDSEELTGNGQSRTVRLEVESWGYTEHQGVNHWGAERRGVQAAGSCMARVEENGQRAAGRWDFFFFFFFGNASSGRAEAGG